MHFQDYELVELFFDVARLSRHIPDEKAPFIGQYRCMLLLEDLAPLSQRELADAMQIRPASLSELLYKLEKKNFILRSPSSKDKRILLVSLTKEGREELTHFHQNRQRAKSSMVSFLSCEEKQRFYDILKKIQGFYLKGEDS